mmetsp:Transcript_1950/g.2660  ORF Transcript_1950/g.2660 Transcript_1950/m.2660 type:complete len:1160 (+) Transcript_1950:323-3802(+)
MVIPGSLDVGFSAASAESQFKIDTFAGISMQPSPGRTEYSESKVNGNWNNLVRTHQNPEFGGQTFESSRKNITDCFGYDLTDELRNFGAYSTMAGFHETSNLSLATSKPTQHVLDSIARASLQQQQTWSQNEEYTYSNMMDKSLHGSDLFGKSRSDSDSVGSSDLSSALEGLPSGAQTQTLMDSIEEDFPRTPSPPRSKKSLENCQEKFNVDNCLGGVHLGGLWDLEDKNQQQFRSLVRNNQLSSKENLSRLQETKLNHFSTQQKSDIHASHQDHLTNTASKLLETSAGKADALLKPLQSLYINNKHPSSSSLPSSNSLQANHGSVSFQSAPTHTISANLSVAFPHTTSGLSQQQAQYPAASQLESVAVVGSRPRAVTYPVGEGPLHPPQFQQQQTPAGGTAVGGQLGQQTQQQATGNGVGPPLTAPTATGPARQTASAPPLAANMVGLQSLVMPGAPPAIHVAPATAMPQRVFLQECIGPNGKVMYTLVPEPTQVSNTPAFFLAQPAYANANTGGQCQPSPQQVQQQQQQQARGGPASTSHGSPGQAILQQQTSPSGAGGADLRFFHPSTAGAACQQPQSSSQKEMPMYTTSAQDNINLQDPRLCQPKDPQYVIRVPMSQVEPRNLVYQTDPRVMIHHDPPTAVRTRDGSLLLYSSPQAAVTAVQTQQDYREKNLRRSDPPMQQVAGRELKLSPPPPHGHGGADQCCSPLPLPPSHSPVAAHHAEHLQQQQHCHMDSSGNGSPLMNLSQASPLPPIPTTFPSAHLGEWDLDRELPPSGHGSDPNRRDRPPRTRPTNAGGNLLEEFRASIGKGRRWELGDLRQNAVQFCRDQHGSRFIQQQFEVASKHERQLLFDEILPHAFSLMTDVFGNYVIQKLFDYGTTDQREELASLLIGNAVQLSLQMYGCRVVQKALEYVSISKLLILVAEFNGHVMKCVQDQNGNHVIQKCIEVASRAAQQEGILPNGETLHSRIQFIIDAFAGQTERLSTHAYGCRVIQRILEHCVNPQKLVILREIESSFPRLVQDQYGNYVIQHILRYGRASDRAMLMEAVKANLLSYSQHKFASNVVEKCLQYGSYDERAQIIMRLFQYPNSRESLLQQMVCDPYANYVVQKIIDVADEDQRNRIVNELRANSAQLKRYTFGKHIISRLEKLHAKRI